MCSRHCKLFREQLTCKELQFHFGFDEN
jgi:hypothetical protein